jgi:TM2 domain-containing membrane protein YozV
MHDQRVWLDSLQRERTISGKDWNTALVLSIFLGIFGADRFYVGRFELGALKLLTFGGYFIWWVIDVILLCRGRMKDGFGRTVQRPTSR